MELSDLSEFGGRLLSPDDKTGMLFEIKDGKVSTYKQPVLLRRRPSLAVHKLQLYYTTSIAPLNLTVILV